VASSGWQAGSSVSVDFHSHVVHLGDLTADPDGKVTGRFTVPEHAHPGRHLIVLTGISPQGQPETQTAQFRVLGPSSECDTRLVRRIERRYHIELPEPICRLINRFWD
jgi:hypothetical protein